MENRTILKGDTWGVMRPYLKKLLELGLLKRQLRDNTEFKNVPILRVEEFNYQVRPDIMETPGPDWARVGDWVVYKKGRFPHNVAHYFGHKHGEEFWSSCYNKDKKILCGTCNETVPESMVIVVEGASHHGKRGD